MHLMQRIGHRFWILPHNMSCFWHGVLVPDPKGLLFIFNRVQIPYMNLKRLWNVRGLKTGMALWGMCVCWMTRVTGERERVTRPIMGEWSPCLEHSMHDCSFSRTGTSQPVRSASYKMLPYIACCISLFNQNGTAKVGFFKQKIVVTLRNGTSY